MIQEILKEALEQRKFAPGEVKFAKSSLADDHIKRVVDALVATGKVDKAKLEAAIAEKLTKFAPIAAIAPTLYSTIRDNIVEDTVFGMFWEYPERIDTGASPEFKERTFFKLVRMIAAEHDEFWPLRSYIDGRKLQPKFEFVGGQAGTTNPEYAGIDTAAATPNGVFIFNVNFMQKLMDYAAIKQIHPKGQKYEANGGDIPNGYAYIEFLILHEFMHYTNDDFHYQKVIPQSDPTIINWVGDFRSNYLLVKSGYEQLPLGLYNDSINYDRQKTYVEMYNLVKSEMDKLKQEPSGGGKGQPGEGGGQGRTLADDVADALDKMGDDHKPGTEEGKKESPGSMTEADIDKASERTEGEMKDGKDLTPDQAAQQGKAGKAGEGTSNGTPGAGGTNGASEVNYKQYKPAFNWKTLIGKMISKASTKTEETFSKPSRRSVSSMEVARQVGAAAIKPGEKPVDFAQIKLAFCIDSSGSMGQVIGTVMSNVANLMRAPKFAKSECIISKFSSSSELYKANFYRNKAAKVTSYKEKPQDYPLTVDNVLNVHFGAGTTLSTQLTSELEQMLKDKWNVVLVSDADVLSGENFKNLLKLISAGPGNMFVIFGTSKEYDLFRQRAGFSTPNVTYFQ